MVSAQSDRPDTPATRDALARQVREKVERLHAIRKKVRDLRERHADDVAREERRIEALQRSSSAAEEVVVAGRRELAALEAEIAAAEGYRRRAHEFIRYVSREALPVLRAVVANTASSVSDRDGSREQSFRALLVELEKSVGSTADATEEAIAGGEIAEATDDSELIARAGAVRDFFEAIGNEWEVAADVVLSNELIPLDEGTRREHAWVLRLGLVDAAFISEAGGTVGLWSGDAASPWRLELDAALVARTRRLFAIVRQDVPPAVVPVPVRRVAREPASFDRQADGQDAGETSSRGGIEGSRE